MGLGKTYSTQYLADSNNNTGAAGQVLISTSTGINWSDGTDIIGGPYLPLSAGASYPLTGDLYLGTFNKISGVANDNLVIGIDVNNTSGGSSFDIQMDGASSAFYINNSRNVGIGTTSPGVKLEVDTNSTFAGAAQFGNSTGNRLYILNDDGGNRIQLDAISSGGASNLIFSNGGSESMRIASTGNVGIGTTGPTAKLDVRGSAVFRGGSLGVTIAPSATGADMYFYEGNNPKIYLQSAGPSAFLMDVGIGTASPGAKLDVNGITRVSGDFAGTGQNPLIQLYNTDTSLGANQILGDIDFYQSDPSGGGAGVVGRIRSINDSSFKGEASLTFSTGESGVSFQERMRITSTGNVGIGTTSPGAKLDVQGTQGQLFSVTDDLSGSIFAVADISGVPIFDVNSSGVSYFDGKVGIGTDSPSSKLSIKNDGVQLSLQRADATGAEWKFYSWGSGLNIFPVSASEIYIGRDGATTNLQLHNGILKVLGTGDSYFTGNVGIGTTSPQQHQSTTERVLHISNSNAASLNLDATNGDCYVLSSTAGGNFSIYNDDTNNTAFIIDDASNVGIGTTSPLNKTHIVGPTLATGTETSYGLAVSDVGDETKTLILGYDLVNDVGIIQAIDQQTAWKNLAFGISGNSKVGIGTVSPTSKLEISGPTGSYLSGIGFSAIGTGARTYRTYIGTNGYFYFDDATGGSSRLTIDTSGNVGIGTTSPDELLHVSGSIKWEGVGTAGTLSGGETYVSISGDGDDIALIDSNVGIGTTSPANKLDVVGISRFTHSSSTGYRGAIETVTDNAYPTWDIGWLHARSSSSNYGNVARFNDQNGSQIGAITYSGTTGVSYGTTSDYRLKENIKEISDSISRVKKLKPCRFNFTTEKDRIVDGFIAHEVQEVVPEAVHGEKDALQEDGSIDTQTLETSRLVPVLTKALQEAIDKIEKLEQRLLKLENK